ncbi:MAG TPA: Mpo1-like protein [Vicinamibacteria bacterium]
MSPVLRARFADYAAFHATPGNQACHYVGIPLIVLSLFGLLARVPLVHLGGFPVTLAEVLLVAVSLYYLTLDVPLALLMLAVSAGLVALGHLVPLPLAVGLFVFGWVLQFVGHYAYEKRSPAFFGNLLHLLVGPLWILAKATGRARPESLEPRAVR